MREENKKATGILEAVENIQKMNEAQTWQRRAVKISGVKFSGFFDIKTPIGSAIEYTFVENDKGKTLKSVMEIAPGQSAKKKPDAKPRGALDIYQHDMNVLNARDKALTHSLIFHTGDQETTEDDAIETARIFERYLLGTDAAVREKKQTAMFDTMVQMVVSRVQSAKAPVPCQSVDKYFICDAETRERVYAAAEKTLHVKRDNGFWCDLAKVGKRDEPDDAGLAHEIEGGNC